jgi:L-ascorbate metabolism protein UlaG (beta-lactamase superfamily)
MPARLVQQRRAAPLAEILAAPPGRIPRLYWLGQAGFVIEAEEKRLVIDPYLSDSLAEKYRGKLYPHQRLMAVLVSPLDLGRVDLVLSTHQHTDHMDPDTLRPLMAQQPDVKLVAPKAAREEAMRRADVAAERLHLVEAGERTEPLPGIFVTATRAAHETLERDAAGHHKFLGYVIEIGNWRVWHSGDTIPYEGMVEEVAPLRPDIALLPVNGRSAELLANNVPGNLALKEAIEIGREIGAQAVIAHHFGMFDFNTEDPAAIDRAAAATMRPRLFRADAEQVFFWEATG